MLLDERPHALLVVGIAVGVHQAHRDRLDIVGHQLLHRAQHRHLVERLDDATVGSDALGDLEPARTAHQRLGEGQEQVIDVVALLDADLEHVAETLGRDEADRRALALDDGVGDQRRAVNDLVEIADGDAGGGHHIGETAQRTLGRIGRRGQALVETNGRVALVEQDEVGEGASDIDTGPETLGSRLHSNSPH